jgi:hypothetical protein
MKRDVVDPEPEGKRRESLGAISDDCAAVVVMACQSGSPLLERVLLVHSGAALGHPREGFNRVYASM